jgi:NAD(P)H-hydrate repair Nnr-like enzyme with NAD(P)H-hydrate dehydratase domain
LAQGYSAYQSAVNGVFLHGLAADIAVDDGLSYESLIPSDIINYINEAIVEITG